MMRFLYSFSIHLFYCLIKFVSLFSKKARLWCAGVEKVFLPQGRKCFSQSTQKTENQGIYSLRSLRDLSDFAVEKNIVWFHCASLGEFEQGKPLMEIIKQEDTKAAILVTFFSPSGFEVRKNDPVADFVTYLPIDTPKNAKKFIQIVNPKKVFFIKYEFWYNYMHELAQADIPFYYVSAIFRKNRYFFKNYGKWFLNHLKKCSCFFVQNEASKTVLQMHGIDNVLVTGDTRFDRVYAIAQQPYELDFIVSFKKDKKLLVAGSTWHPDEKILSQLFQKINSQYKLVIAPHVVEKINIERIKKLFSSFSVVCLSEMENKDISNYDVLIIDTIGILSKIYKYADVSYIGGAFKTGLHNILEAAVFNKPLFFGPYYQKFNEAVELVQFGGAFSIKSTDEILQKLNHFADNPETYKTVCDICKTYLSKNLNATEKIWFYFSTETQRTQDFTEKK